MNKYRYIIGVLFLLFVLPSNQLRAEIWLPKIFGDHMVLQQNFDVPFWGNAIPGEEIKIELSWRKSPVITRVNADGKWFVKVKTPKAGGPFVVKFIGKNDRVILNNVLVGEVWVCSGQSNMEMPVKGWLPREPVFNSDEAISTSANPKIRLFTVAKKMALTEQDTLEGSWLLAKPETVSEFSATAYFFGRKLYEELKVPIGIVHTSWGGTVAEAWTSNETLISIGDFNTRVFQLDSVSRFAEQLKQQDVNAEQDWQQQLENPVKEFVKYNYNDSNWEDSNVPGSWESNGYPNLDGIVWYRKTIEIPSDWVGQDLEINLGALDDMDNVFFNEKEIGNTLVDGKWTTNRKYSVPASLVKKGKNQITIRIIDTGGDGGFMGRAEELIMYPKASPDKSVTLAGVWKLKIQTRKPVKKFVISPNDPSVLFNAMIAPLIPYAIKGVIWYQGESNVGRSEQYERLFPSMIKGWRKLWNQGPFSFYFTQIAPYNYGGDNIAAAYLRDAQRKSLSTENTGMAVTLDVGDTLNIHPGNKIEVGERLAKWALAKDYNKKIMYSGPLIKRAKAEFEKVALFFDYASGLKVLKSNNQLFEIAGKDRKFFPAVVNVKKDHLELLNPNVDQPVFVRYSFRSNSGATLFNDADLPASSFEIKVD